MAAAPRQRLLLPPQARSTAGHPSRRAQRALEEKGKPRLAARPPSAPPPRRPGGGRDPGSRRRWAADGEHGGGPDGARGGDPNTHVLVRARLLHTTRGTEVMHRGIPTLLLHHVGEGGRELFKGDASLCYSFLTPPAENASGAAGPRSLPLTEHRGGGGGGRKRALRRGTRRAGGRALPGAGTRRGCGTAEGRRCRGRAFDSRLPAGGGPLTLQKSPLKKKKKKKPVNGCFLSQAAALPRSRREPPGRQPCPRKRPEAVAARWLCIPKPQPRRAPEALSRKAPVPLSLTGVFTPEHAASEVPCWCLCQDLKKGCRLSSSEQVRNSFRAFPPKQAPSLFLQLNSQITERRY